MENLKMKNTKIETVALNPGTALALEMRRKAEELLEQAKKLELARGTQRDVTKQAKAATTPARPDGSYHVGDEGPTGELMQVVQRMLIEHPRTFRELKDMTGAGDNRIKGVLMRLQRESTVLVNLGTDARAIWFAPGPEAMKRLERVMKTRKR